MTTLDLPVVGSTPDPEWATKLNAALAQLNTDKVDSVIVTTGSEARPAGADVVLWVDPSNLGAANADEVDVVIGGSGALVPAGGSTGQMLGKVSGADWDLEWVTPSGGGGGGATPPPGADFELFPRLSMSTFTCVLQNGWINMLPFWLPYAVTFDRIAIKGAGDDGDSGDDPTGVIRCGIYEVSGNVGAAGTLLHNLGSRTVTDSERSASGGWFDWETGGPWSLDAGLYYMAFGVSGMTGSPSYIGSGPAQTGFAHIPALPGTGIVRGPAQRRWIMSPDSGDVLPTTTGTLNVNGGGDQSYFPAVWMRTDS